MKIIFMGTPDFSANVLEILNSKIEVSAVVTGVDKQVGRGFNIKPCPLKVKATELNIPVLQFEKVSKYGIETIKALEPDLVITCAFGQILSDEFLKIPKYGVLNVHASLLPKYRGSSPIQWSILNGEKYTGITIMRTVKEIDAGDVLLQKTIEICKTETAGELFDRLSILGGQTIVEAVKMIENGSYNFVAQDHSKATHCSMIKKTDGLIDFSKTAFELDCFVRGMTPWPSAFCDYKGKMLKIFELNKVSESIGTYSPGEIISCDQKTGIKVQCGDGIIEILSLQLEGSKRMSAQDFTKGRSLEIGYIL